MYVRDTIAAICTPVGEGGIGVIRISGSDSLSIANRIVKKHSNGGLKSHRFSYGSIVDPETGETLDEVMAVFMKSPNSYTREDVLEIQCHGGYINLQLILDLVLKCDARLAEPGEFTKRAFLNGRIDLVQAESVVDLIRSKTEASLALARHQSTGLLSQRIMSSREALVSALSLIEAFIDFPGEDIDPASMAVISQHVNTAMSIIDQLIAGYNEGRVLREGVSVVIAGRPNVGKSSLLNTLLKEKRAIVTAIPGTTRDVIEEVVSIRGLPVRLMDTAGIRESADHVEREGVLLALEKINAADLVLFVIDGSTAFTIGDQEILDTLAERTYLVIANKADLCASTEIPAPLNQSLLRISTVTGHGIDALKDKIVESFLHGHSVDSRDYVVVSQARHKDILLRASEALCTFSTNFSAGVALELLSVDLRLSLDAIGEITGETTPDEVLDRIFSKFCIGK
jgi:tRNA modification GTPase